ncbi:Peptide-N4-(N-acetyl-beta-glucosaminyl)asparagine amidase A [Candida maltosa Xu316]
MTALSRVGSCSSSRHHHQQQQPLKYGSELDHHPIFRNLQNIVDTTPETTGNKTTEKEIITVSNPYVPNPHYGEPVYSSKLIHHKFGNSWGKPAVVNFTSPANVSFNAVVLSLHTKVDGVQYDRLLNLFVNGAQIWRSSTIEPGNKKVFSYFKKDVTKYANLFKGENIEILLQLDNLLSDKLTGVFDVELSVDFFQFHKPHHRGPHHGPHEEPSHDEPSHEDNDVKEEEIEKRHRFHHEGKHHKGKDGKHHKDKDGKHKKPEHPPKEPEHPPHHPPHDPEHPPHHPHHHRFYKERQLFSVRKPADQVYPLTVSAKPQQAPVVYLSSGRLAVNLPKVAKNTTRLQLSVFTSGNAADEFWYTNVIDKFKDVFADEGNQLIGKGPVRIVNIYFNGKKIATQSPEPVIFTGGISPALWSPVVSFNAFDVPSIDVDVSGLLPYLWEHQAVEDKVLEIEVSNGLGEIGKADSNAVNENWITAANLLTFENDQVVESSGEVVNIDELHTGHVIGVSIPYTRSIQQVIDARFGAQLISNISLTLKDGRILNTTISSYSLAEVVNVQSYRRYGDKQSIAHVGRSVSSVIVQDNDLPEHEGELSSSHHKHKLPDNTIFVVNTTLHYPLTLSLEQHSKDIGAGGDFFVDFDVSLVHAKTLDLVFGGGFGRINTASGQNGTSRFFLSSKGNHGYGSTHTKYKSKFRFGKHGRKYKRVVDAVNGTIVYDESKSKPKEAQGTLLDIMQHSDSESSASSIMKSMLHALKNDQSFSMMKFGCQGMMKENHDGETKHHMKGMHRGDSKHHMKGSHHESKD